MFQRRALQAAIAIAGLVPVTAGGAGVLLGPQSALTLFGPPSSMTHAAYLSGLLLGIGLAFWSLIPEIEKQGRACVLLTGIVVVGGLARAFTAIQLGIAHMPVLTPSILLPLVMELGVTPALCLWQQHIARQAANA